MASRDYFFIQQWIKNEQNQDDEEDVDYFDDEYFTPYNDVSIVEENNSHNGE